MPQNDDPYTQLIKFNARGYTYSSPSLFGYNSFVVELDSTINSLEDYDSDIKDYNSDITYYIDNYDQNGEDADTYMNSLKITYNSSLEISINTCLKKLTQLGCPIF